LKSAYSLAKLTYAWVWSTKLTILKLFIPIFLMSIIATYFGNMFLIIICAIAGFYVASTSIVQIHRSIILDTSADQIVVFPKIEKTFFLYLGTWFIIATINQIVETLSTFLLDESGAAIVLYILLTLVFIHIIARAYFIFPIVAVNNKIDFRYAFSISKNKFWMVFNSTLLMILPALVLIIFIFASVIIGMGTLKLDFNLIIPMYVFSYFMSITVINIHYSILFKELTKNHGNLDSDDPSDKTPEEKNPYKGAFDDSGSSW
jgi:hypothetical protein